MKKLFLFIIFLPALLSAQESTTQDPIDEQFEELITKSNNYQQYKVVEKQSLYELRRRTNDHVSQLNGRIDSLSNQLVTEEKEQAALQEQLLASNSQIETLNSDKDSINFLGMQLDKPVYNTIMWSIIGILAAVLVLLFMQFKKSHYVTSQSKKELATTEAELEELRRKSIEKEQKLGRQLQDERNKLSRLKKEQA